MTDWPYIAAIETLKFCQVALDGSPCPKLRRVLWRVHRWAVARLDQLVRSDAARVDRIDKHNHSRVTIPDVTAADLGTKILANLARQTASNRAAGEALNARIAHVMAENPGATAKIIQAKLSCDPLPSIRTVQRHMQTINATSSAWR